MKQLKSHDSTPPMNCQDEGGKCLMSEALKEWRKCHDLVAWATILEYQGRTKMDSLICASWIIVWRALDISQQPTSSPGSDPLVKWQAGNQPHVSRRTHQAGQGSSVYLSTCGGRLLFLASCLMRTASDKLRLAPMLSPDTNNEAHPAGMAR